MPSFHKLISRNFIVPLFVHLADSVLMVFFKKIEILKTDVKMKKQ